ncbi:unnamed protein product [Lactuca virosa]|uniref:Uncharacterized protein n=1 Tax=Lactuca virosa TaxID=75947 RepID=A0AAU9LZR4_9ASTR|nr:unnamed protein product [Lactuca virosa]
MTLGDQTTSGIYHKMPVVSNILANIESPIPEKMLISHLLNSLTPCFDDIATVIRHQNPLPSLLRSRFMLTLEENRLNRNRPMHVIHSDHSSSYTVLHIGSSSQPQDKSNNHSSNNWNKSHHHNHGDNRMPYNLDNRRHQ